MSSQYKINGTVVLANNDLTLQGVLTTTVNLSSSNNISNTITVNTSSWTQIDQGTATNLRYIFLSNPNNTSSVMICQNTSSIQYNAILNVNDTALIPFSGSVTLWAKALGQVSGSTVLANNPSYLQYISSQS
jgi:hypothetical protein